MVVLTRSSDQLKTRRYYRRPTSNEASMSMCFNPRCNGTDFLCGKCKKMYPMLAASLAEKKRERRGNGGNRRRGAGPIARGIAAAGIIGAVGSSTGNPRQSDTTTQKNWGDSSQRAEGARQGRTQRGATRDQGNRNRGSGQS